jgi:hypothetical protein
MTDVYVIMYAMHSKDYGQDQVAAVCTSLDRAQVWLVMERLGKSWTDLSRIEGLGINMRIITEFNETDWSSYYIRKHRLED